ncbi:translocation/assembly module TamB domain-containing protein [Geothermobacter hydrogeniphilus]|uniref:Translocation and assembly module TamB C-terminal domain-containing protein n=1 Tax=Geothermobacter hydrogeniphilus TaxID=1969733 RepID=A0A1X0Y6E2_9BACT|nr:translocation/assembly module TamB domain-containing protein [Geothermobacter hydrogeniphilus]ORJ60652.1 hypothetical protein B5V00_07405 [Geothermobacter hydrogeniphilus]
MTRRFKGLFAALTLLLSVLVAGGWLLYSSSGAGWLLQRIDGFGGVRIEVGSLQGQLATGLDLQGGRVAWDGGRLAFAELQFGWNPWALFGGGVDIEQLRVTGLDLWVDTTATDSDPLTALPLTADRLELPSPWPLPAWLHGEIRQLRLSRFNYHSGDGVTVIADRIEGRLQLRDRQLQISPAVYMSPYVELSGDLRWDLRTMRLDYRAEVVLPEELVSGESLGNVGLSATATGRLQVQGDWRAYRGTLLLRNGPTRLAGDVFGNLDGVWLRHLQGDWLQGQLEQGRLDLDWRRDFRMDWRVAVGHLNPAETVLGRAGDLSFAGSGSLRVPETAPLVIAAAVDNLHGQLQGYPLTGHGRIRLVGEELSFEDLQLRSEGLVLSAAGDLAERFDFQLQVADLSRWIEGAAGKIVGSGWLRFDDGGWAGDGELSGQQLQWRGLRIGDLQVNAAHPGAEAALNVNIRAADIDQGGLQISTLNAVVAGLTEDHRLDLRLEGPEGSLALSAVGSWDGEEWRGTVEHFTTRLLDGAALILQHPAAVRWSTRRWAVAPLLVTGAAGESLRLAGHYQVERRDGDISGSWRKLRLERLASLLPEQILRGESSGSFSLQLQAGRPVQLALKIDAAGELRHQSWDEALRELHLDLDWHQRRLVFSVRAVGSREAGLEFSGDARQPLGLDFPEEGQFHFSAVRLRLAALRRWLPAELSVRGQVALEGEGRWLGGGRFRLSGQATGSGAELSWRDSRGVLHSRLKEAGLEWQWQEKTLRLGCRLVLNDGGGLHGELALPLAAAWPPVIDRDAPVTGAVSGELAETGMLEALLPMPIEELSGRLVLDLGLGGTLHRPALQGRIGLRQAGAYLPQLGISLRPIELDMRLSGDRAEIETLRIVSGASVLRGRGWLKLGGEGGFRYRLELQGDNFLAADLPELVVELSPEIELSGDAERLQVTGQVLVPRLELRGVRAAPEVPPSPDVVVLQTESPVAADATAWQPEVLLKVVLGDRVTVAAGGVNARLGGAVDISLAAGGVPRADGEIHIVEGDFAAYGVRLKIRHGRLRYRSAPLNNPSLDILAMRDLGQLQAGVQIGGTARRPRITLHSRPAMPEKDILLAIVTGRRASSSGGDEGMLMLGTGALMAPGESLFSKIGLTNIDLQGLFSGEGGLRLRHRLAERWEVESVLGINSGIDLFYLIEFH